MEWIRIQSSSLLLLRKLGFLKDFQSKTQLCSSNDSFRSLDVNSSLSKHCFVSLYPTSKKPIWSSGRDKNIQRTYLAYIVRSNPGSKDRSVILLDKMCMCVEYLVAILILLCSLQYISLLWNIFARTQAIFFFSLFYLFILDFFCIYLLYIFA